jgi:hypothetical protein
VIDLLDLLLIANFCFDKPVPWWLWCLGVLATLGGNWQRQEKLEALKAIATRMKFRI